MSENPAAADEAPRKTSVKDLAERFGGSVQTRPPASMSASAPKDSGFKVCNGIHVSSQDDREYRALTLPNKLEVLLVHDASADKGSAALDVNVGHFKDPAEFPGLAHFCEHMLFLGTKKYPDENSYSAFLNEHGGGSNAWTSMENTNFFFDVTHPHLLEALDRFAQFFVSPLFTEGATEREMNAVDSENAKNLQSDTWRLMQLFRSGADSAHPFSKYGTGNLQTLRDDPRAQGLDVRTALLELHKQYYSANLMRLVVLGRESLDQLQSAVESLFCDVRNADVPVPSFGTEPYGDEQLCTEVRAVPIKDQRIIELAFFMPAQWQQYKAKPASILSHLVGHEGAGSLLSLLKSRGWVNELSAGLWNDNHDFASFSIYLEATAKGIEEAHQVVECCFGYLNMLRDARGGASGTEWTEHWVFEEVQAVNAMNFRFKAKEDPSSYTSWLAGQMQKVKSEHFVSGGSLFYEYDPAAIGAALDFLVPSRCVLTLVSRTFEAEGETDSEEKWYGTKYRRSKIDDELLAHWASVAPADGLRLPDRNDLISTDFSLVVPRALGTAESAEQGNRGALPKALELSEPSLVRGWFKGDDVFSKPKLSVMLNIVSPTAYESAESVVLADLFVRHTKEMLQEYSYMAETASMNYVLQPTIQGMELYVSGFSQKLGLLLDAVLRVVAACEVEDALFERVKDKARRKYENFKKEQPYQHAMYNSSFALQVPRIHNDAKVEAIASISSDDLRRFGKQLIDRVFVEGLVHGNIDESGARALLESTVTALAPRRVLGTPQRDIRCVQLKRTCDGGTGYAVCRPAQNPDDENSAVEVIFQVGRQESHITSMKLELLAHIIREPAFDQLRTKEQLGYLVWSGTHGMCATEGLRFIVQSDKFDAAYLDGRIEALLGNGLEDAHPAIAAEQPATTAGDEEDGAEAAAPATPVCFGRILREMTDEQFGEHVDAVVAKKLEKDKTPWQETLRHWREVTDMTYTFDRPSVEAAALRKLKKDDVLEFYLKHIARGAPFRARLTSQLFGGGRALPPAPPTAPDADVSAAMQINGVEAFKRSMPLFPGRALGTHAKM